jgi:hypothetical protein
VVPIVDFVSCAPVRAGARVGQCDRQQGGRPENRRRGEESLFDLHGHHVGELRQDAERELPRDLGGNVDPLIAAEEVDHGASRCGVEPAQPQNPIDDLVHSVQADHADTAVATLFAVHDQDHRHGRPASLVRGEVQPKLRFLDEFDRVQSAR